MENKITHRRKILVVDKKFQRNFMIKFSLLASIGGILSVFLLFIYVHYTKTVTTVFHNSRLTMMSTEDFVWPSVCFSGLVVFFAVGFVTFLLALYVSHRIAGPAYRITKDMEEVAGGNLNKLIRVREKDELESVAKGFNTLMTKLKGDFTSLKKSAEQLNASSALSPQAAEQVKVIKEILDRYHV